MICFAGRKVAVASGVGLDAFLAMVFTREKKYLEFLIAEAVGGCLFRYRRSGIRDMTPMAV